MDPWMLVVVAVALMGAGILFVFLEVIFPSFGVLTLLSVVAFIGSVIAAYSVSPVFGIVMACLAPTLIITTLVTGYKVLPRTRVGRLLMPDNPRAAEVSGSAADGRLKALEGRKGTARSALRPGGVVEIEGRRYGVVTQGEMIEKGAEVEVAEVEGNRVVVVRSGEGPRRRGKNHGESQ